jgi:hypothetical protein
MSIQFSPYERYFNAGGQPTPAGQQLLANIGRALVPQNGTAGQVLSKLSDTSYDLTWLAAGGGGVTSWGAITGTLASQADLAAALAAKQDTLVSATNIKTVNGSSLLGSGDLVVSATGLAPVATSGLFADLLSKPTTLAGYGITDAPKAVAATLAFGASFTDKAQTVVTGQTWVTAASKIIPQVLTPAGTDPDEMSLLNFRVHISDLVVGTGWTVTLYSEALARGDYTVNCIGI